MSQKSQQHEIAKKRIVYEIPCADAVTVRQDIEYRATDGGALTMDLYYPPDWKGEARIPAVVFVSGYSDLGFQRMLGCKLKEMESYISWGQLTAVSGMVAITYSPVEPASDIHALLQHVRQNAASLGIDESKIAVWACSGSGPLALSLLMEEARDYLKCAVLCYPFTIDLDGATGMVEAATMFGFTNACAGKTVGDLAQDIPLFIARAGKDQTPHLNEALDRFLATALACNLPITIANHPEGPHAFDVFHDSRESREIISRILTFMRSHLLTRG
jgi:acetyl esterase/lipase